MKLPIFFRSKAVRAAEEAASSINSLSFVKKFNKSRKAIYSAERVANSLRRAPAPMTSIGVASKNMKTHSKLMMSQTQTIEKGLGTKSTDLVTKFYTAHGAVLGGAVGYGYGNSSHDATFSRVFGYTVGGAILGGSFGRRFGGQKLKSLASKGALLKGKAGQYTKKIAGINQTFRKAGF